MSDETRMILDEMQKMKEDLRQEFKSEMREMAESIKTDLRQEFKSDMREMAESIKTELRQEIRDGDNAIRMILENDIRPKLSLLAEGHADLNRKLDEVKETLKGYELLPTRVTRLESDVRVIKQKLAMV